MKIGRNAPCPCGSGKKYKQCCLSKASAQHPRAEATQPNGSETAPATDGAEEADRRSDGNLGSRAGRDSMALQRNQGGEDGLQPHDSEQAEDWSQFWDDYQKASIDTRMAIARRLVEEESNFDDELAYDLLADLVVPLQHLGRPADADAALDLVRDRHPAVYESQRGWFDEWRVENALIAGRDIERPLLGYASCAQTNIDGFLRLVDRLLYHGEIKGLLAALNPAWAAIKDSRDIMEHGKWEFQRAAMIAVVHHQLTLDSSAREFSPELFELIAPIVELDRTQIDESLRHRTGETEHQWCIGDFEPARDPEGEALFQLLMGFCHYLHSQHGWPLSRAELASHEIGRYLASDSEGRERSRSPVSGRSGRKKQDKRRHSSDRSPPSPLRPTPAGADRHVARLLTWLNPAPARAAVFYQALPLWVAFLVHQSLMPETDRPLARQLVIRLSPLNGLLERLIADPVMQENVRRVQETHP